MSRTRRHDDILLTRHLAGELDRPEAAALERRLAAEPELAARRHRLATVWDGVELPPPADPPPGFATRVARRAMAQGEPAPAVPLWGWARTAGAAALVSGLLLGGGLGSWAEPWLRAALPLGAGTPVAVAGDAEIDDPLVPESAWESAALPTLADTYWSDLEPADTLEPGSEELR